MKRTRKYPRIRKVPDAILTSDWHLREDKPVCRTDDFWETQLDKVGQVAYLQNHYGCPVLHAGDLFHHWKPSPFLLSWCMTQLPNEFYTIYGQHDLPQHNYELKVKSGIHTLSTANKVRVFSGGHYGQSIGKSWSIKGREVGMLHKFVWDGKTLPWPGCEESTANMVLRDNPEFDLIVTGDHHKPFTHMRARKYGHQLLVNPGCLTRQAADYADHKPRVYFYYAETNTVEPYYLYMDENAVTRVHLEKREERDKRIEAFIDRLSHDWETDLSFEENLRRFFSSNKVRKDVRQLVYKSIDEDIIV